MSKRKTSAASSLATDVLPRGFASETCLSCGSRAWMRDFRAEVGCGGPCSCGNYVFVPGSRHPEYDSLLEFSLSPTETKATAAFGKATQYLELHDYAAARVLLLEVLSMARTCARGALESAAHGNLGLAAIWAGVPLEGIDHLESAVEIDRRIGDRPGLARDLCNYGVALLLTSRLEEAKRALDEAFREQRAMEDWQGVEADLLNLIRISRWLHLEGEADRYLAMGGEIFDQLGDLDAVERLNEARTGPLQGPQRS